MKKKNDIVIKYDGDYPNLCRGKLSVTINGRLWDFPEGSLSSGGSVWFDDDWTEHIQDGAWEVMEWPEGFPEEMKDATMKAINNEIPYGCCGGCI